MSAFKDIQNREYNILITVGTAEDVRSRVKDRNMLPVDLFGIVQSGKIDVFLEDVPLLVDVIYVIVEEQAKGYDVDARQFGRSLAGPQIEAATAAFMEALVNFSQNPKQREMLKMILSKTEELQGMALEKAFHRVDTITKEMGPEIDRQLQNVTVQSVMEEAQKVQQKKPSGKSSTGSQES